MKSCTQYWLAPTEYDVTSAAIIFESFDELCDKFLSYIDDHELIDYENDCLKIQIIKQEPDGVLTFDQYDDILSQVAKSLFQGKPPEEWPEWSHKLESFDDAEYLYDGSDWQNEERQWYYSDQI